MILKERIDLMVKLGDYLRSEDELFEAWMYRTYHNNRWFTIEHQKQAAHAIAYQFLTRTNLEQWINAYDIQDDSSDKVVGLVLAGNIPMVGFHDVLSVFMSGHKVQIKLSDKDPFILPFLIEQLSKWEGQSKAYFQVVDKLNGYDAVIATGSNNTARYFESYFSHVPNIIRANRTSVALIDGQESAADFAALGKDIFTYFGLGCRNVSKLYVPKGYDFQGLMEALHEFRKIVLHDKYKNNFDYNYAMFEINRTPYINNGCLLLTEDTSMHSRIAALHFEYYEDVKEVEQQLIRDQEAIQCQVSREGATPFIPFGKAQEPSLLDYADGEDTMQFLASI